MDDLRKRIAHIIEPHLAEDDWGAGLHERLADEIIQLVESDARYRESSAFLEGSRS